MDIERVVKSYNDFLVRFGINSQEEEPVWCLKTANSWYNFTSSPDSVQSDFKYQIERLDGDPYGLYLASGTFKKGSIKRVVDKTVGRAEENLKRILEIPLDADYLKYIFHQENAKEAKEIKELEQILHSQSDEGLSGILDTYLKFIKEALGKAKVPYSEVIRSGYGYYVKIFIEVGDQTRIKEIRQFHKILGSFLNDLAGFELFDKQCSDAGTRVTRMEGSYNLKNPVMPRLVYAVESNNQFYRLDDLTKLISQSEKPTYSHSYSNGSSSCGFKEEQITKILKPYWIETQRQNLAMYVAGFLSKADVPWSDVKELIMEIATVCNDDEIAERLSAIKSTYEKAKRGEEVKGYTGLAEILSPDDLEILTSLFSPQKQINPLTVREIMAVEICKERFIVENIAMRGGITMISGDPGAGKTWLILEIARCVILGEPLFNYFETQKK